MKTAYDGQSLQSYGLRLQREARRSPAASTTRPAGRSSLAPRLRALVGRR